VDDVARHGLETRLGDPVSIATEYADFRIGPSPANNDRAAGYLRLCELLHVEPGRIAPPWAPIPGSVGGAPGRDSAQPGASGPTLAISCILMKVCLGD
jgi:hypothetical protein